ncbi:MAG TPA: DoxX family membrane protein [Candidatus Saccharimonadales bacterium]|nr:DoxX family membrane protein [Candidatus Saccharimonadales bacterium]
MTETLTETTAVPASQSKGLRYTAAIVRILLGLMFLVFGLNGFLDFMPRPKEMPPEIMNVVGGLMKGGYMYVASGTEVLVAVLLLTNRFVPLALALLAPIVVGILTFHVAIALATIGPGIVVLLMELFLAWAYRGAFRPMLRAKVSPGG